MNLELRDLQPSDRPQLARLLSRIPSFDASDQALALELIDIALQQPAQKDYLFLLAFDPQANMAGYACYGPTPLTDRVYSLYWIAVEPVLSGQGIGTFILQAVEETLRSTQARLLLIETSSAPDYKLTRRFYLKNGYPPVETLKDFYRDGEDRITFGKRF